MGKQVTTTQLAEHLGVSRQTLDKAVKSGRLTVASRDARGRPLFDLVISVKEWADRGERQQYQSRHGEGKDRGGRPGKTELREAGQAFDRLPSLDTDEDIANFLATLSGMSAAQKLNEVDLLKKVWETRLSELKVKREEKTLIDVESVRRQGVELGAVLMGALNAMPARLSDQLSAMTDAREIYALIEDEIGAMIASVRKFCGAEIEDGAAIAGAPDDTGGK